MLSIKTKKTLAVTAFCILFLVTRIPFLGFDTINPDAVNWHFRSEQFVVGLKSGDLLKTYQHYHPGVTLMWIIGLPIEIVRQVNPEYRVYDEHNFIFLHQVAKYALVLAQFVLTMITFLALKDVLGWKRSLLTVGLLSFEPFFLGNSRLLHLDVLLTQCVFLALVFAHKYTSTRSTSSIIISGLFSGLAFLTKSVGGLTLALIAIYLLVHTLTKQTIKKALRNMTLFAVTGVGTIFIFFPALWVAPIDVLTGIYTDGLRIGTRRGHDQIVLGEYTDSAGPAYYPTVLALKTSPVLLAGTLVFMVFLVLAYRKSTTHRLGFVLMTSVFYAVYFVGMSLASKKIDRYMLPVYPLFCVATAYALTTIEARIQGWKQKLALCIPLAAGLAYPLIAFYPYYFTYTNPVFGSTENANRIIGQKPFGVGIPELKNLIVSRYGANVGLGFIDKKPMSMIYPNSKLFDIRVDGTKKYDLIVLGPNEVMPENVIQSQLKYKLDYNLYINGLAYWRVYKKDATHVVN